MIDCFEFFLNKAVIDIVFTDLLIRNIDDYDYDIDDYYYDKFEYLNIIII